MARYATGVSVVAAVHDGVRYGMTVNSLTSVSLHPTLMLFCCEHDASLHQPLLAAGSWAVSVLSGSQQAVAAWFATRGRPGVDQFDGQAARPGVITGAPVLDGALAWFECRTWATYDGGDHTIIVGEVLDLGCGEDLPGLLYFRSDYSATTD
jgi:flavin reductase (DIM6/NTAB) family NADH-FMN oxidoreductase RutF